MLLGNIEVINKDFRIESTTHALQRMKERGINQEIVKAVVSCLDYKVLLYNNSGEEIAISDQEHDITVIIEVRLNKIVVITVIDSANIYIKEGTRLEEIA